MANDENDIYGITRSQFFGFLLFWGFLGMIVIYLFFSINKEKFSFVAEKNWLWILLVWLFYASVLASNVRMRMKNANMEDNMSFLCYIPFIGFIALIDGLLYQTNPFYKRPTNKEIEDIKRKKMLLKEKIKLIHATRCYFEQHKTYLQFRNIEEDYEREFNGMFHDLNPDIENYNALIKHIAVIENQIAPKESFFQNYIIKPCQHDVAGGYLIPHRCSQCLTDFFAWGEKIKALEQKKIEIDRAIAEEEKREKKEAYAEYLKIQRISKKKQALERYKNAFKGKMSPEEIGAAYERYVGYLYENQGYSVVYNGIIKGKQDDSVDIIAKKQKEIHIIQCKWYKEKGQIHINTIRQFNDKFIDIKRENPNKKVLATLFTVYDNLDESAKEKLLNTEIAHRVVPFNYEYPMVKCNINEGSGEKIYHLPGVGQYDRIKINIKKNECYVKTIEEAENLGFRAVE